MLTQQTPHLITVGSPLNSRPSAKLNQYLELEIPRRHCSVCVLHDCIGGGHNTIHKVNEQAHTRQPSPARLPAARPAVPTRLTRAGHRPAAGHQPTAARRCPAPLADTGPPSTAGAAARPRPPPSAPRRVTRGGSRHYTEFAGSLAAAMAPKWCSSAWRSGGSWSCGGGRRA